MELPKAGERWILLPCKRHDNIAGAYVWQAHYDQRPNEARTRIECGCFFRDDGAGATVKQEVAVTEE